MALNNKLHILLLSPYHSGSHQAWAEGFQTHTSHRVTLLTLPGESWKWRMHGAAVTLAQRVLEMAVDPIDLVLVDDMFDLATFIALTRKRLSNARFVLYMHENQLLYPLPKDQSKGPMRRNWGLRERQYVLINWKSMLAADAIFFNSVDHRSRFLTELPRFLNHYQSYGERETVEILREKSAVLPVGIDFARLDTPLTEAKKAKEDLLHRKKPLILWNQRWEYDKNPDQFVKLILKLARAGIDFELAICGEAFQRGKDQETPFTPLQKELPNQIIHFGFASADRYRELLWQSDITISTAKHEFFGISILEAVYCHTFPLLPDRLSYPELFPKGTHGAILYRNERELFDRLVTILPDHVRRKMVTDSLSTHVKKYGWPQIIRQYDQKIGTIVQNGY